MTKKEHISYWTDNSEKDWKRARRCFEDKDYVFSLFCIHLCLEKLIKGIWVKNNEDNFPPRIHNLVRLLEKAKVVLTDEQLLLLDEMNRYQLESRYPDYVGKIYKECTKKYTSEIIDKVETLKKCLEREVQKK